MSSDSARSDLSRLSAQEWVDRHAVRLLDELAAANRSLERTAQAVDLLRGFQRIIEALLASLHGFQVATGWPGEGHTAGVPAAELAGRVERCLVALAQAARGAAPAAASGADRGAAEANQRFEDTLRQFREWLQGKPGGSGDRRVN